jgi:hypothetical protein
MIGKLMSISGKNLTFQDNVGRKVTLKVSKEHATVLDIAVENLGCTFDVVTIEGEITDLKVPQV